jgi:hypothetical protein
VSRIPAPEIEQAIVSALKKYITEQNSGTSDRDDPINFDHDILATLISRIEVQRTQLVMSLKPTDRSTEFVTLSVPGKSRRQNDAASQAPGSGAERTLARTTRNGHS